MGRRRALALTRDISATLYVISRAQPSIVAMGQARHSFDHRARQGHNVRFAAALRREDAHEISPERCDHRMDAVDCG